MLIPRTVFWVVVLTAVFMITLGLSQLAEASTEKAKYTKTWCDEINGVRVVDNGLVIPCLTKTHAIFRESSSLAKYMIEYRDKYQQIPALIIRERQ